MDKIDKFSGQWSFLSNAYSATIRFRGRDWKTAEHALQGSKAQSDSQRDVIGGAKSPSEAKRLGWCIPLPPGWEEEKSAIMKEILHQKFSNPFLREMLKGTGSALLVNGSHPADSYWGFYDGEGENILGRLLMEVREEIVAEDSIDFIFSGGTVQ